ncbi:MAG: L7Ae/L30e/S12e/Gadd45 family ribosomal protein [bacterium]
MSAALLFLGLVHRAGKLTIGEESCGVEARAKHARLILSAADAARNSLTRAKNYAEDAKCPAVTLPWTKAELGEVLGRGAPGMLAVCDFGMAAAFMQKLDGEFPDRYAAAGAETRCAAERALQRKKEAKKHRENLKKGKK